MNARPLSDLELSKERAEMGKASVCGKHHHYKARIRDKVAVVRFCRGTY